MPVDLSKEHSLRVAQEEYKAKLRIGTTILPDPFSLRDGWRSEEAMASWPSLYFTDINEYMKTKTTTEIHTQLCNEYKLGKSYR